MPGSGRQYRWLLLLVNLCLASHAWGDITVTDDTGQTIRLDHSARRIVALSPHITELLYAIGAGEQVVGTVAHSDYPPAAKSIPRVGDAGRIDMEKLLVLQPDLVIGWASGNSPATVTAVRDFQIPLYLVEPASLAGIADNLQDLGVLTGNQEQAAQVADRFRRQLAGLQNRYGEKRPVALFYQVWQRPLLTFSGRHLVDQVIRLCGGVNVFAGLPGLTPRVSIEAVIALDPEVIVAGDHTDGTELRSFWGQWPELRAVKQQTIYTIHPDLLHRQTPRLLEGAAELCSRIDQARGNSH